MVEWFLPLFPCWCTKHWYFSGEAVTLLHCIQLLFACCWAQVGALGCWIVRKTEICASQVQTGTTPRAALFVSPVLEDWRQGHGVHWEVDQVKTELISDSEFTFGFSWVNACIKCPGFHSSAPLRITCVTMTAALRSGAGRMLGVEHRGFHGKRRKAWLEARGCFPRGISDQSRRRGEKYNIVFCSGGFLAAKLFFYLMLSYQSRF